MLFTEQDLNHTNVMTLLENANYLSEDESLINPKTIPVKEVSRLGYGVVRFDDVDRLAESHGVDYIDAMYAIAEASEMNPEYLAVAVPEEDLIAYPEIVNELANIVVQPLSEESFAYQYVDMCLEAWDNTGDEGYLGAIIDDTCLEEAAMLLEDEVLQIGPAGDPGGKNISRDNDSRMTKVGKFIGRQVGKVKSNLSATKADLVDSYKAGKGFTDTASQVGKAAWRHKGTIGATTAAAGAAGYGVYRFAKWVKEANNRPKSWIGKKIAALRSIYSKWMQHAQRNPKQAGMIKSAAAKILSIIDALMAKLQRAAG